ncbi:MAG: 50S ribosomal protein L4 [Candidatus Zambryskibacteria bacterium RIFCSPLOWO2_02_FULL_51_21]|uniref:Large ribosomal subunit protein uL4 n=1 Tax=Candidatus Zambryskibacteria bacterium RIFCSPHIGHO2_02_FULL_43_37 TaxID=1802749 RepID=A0A1G2TGH6_9BACT|nr:MAG: 50S ribosomal protein L4 [Candidatus Zambryskibacteria bacterium RIFCSPHIGHO2_01_FULL_52_18]OHA96405.1 MAG: 50S ribosomal protein L4 [Candidatus Zambryskibacteria bacterium RIFCSPHIGHO2_02_FULL_43_37]OHB07804.1 MAG: 50S ribosomal protein L4 [Candidatus Zambryskibacteria bacterium RIFCSPLOWO2_01_FULL_52_12]OHB11335.1 MAG: 50S ribosomal protein L4 [Candidatus Zambryskibacteria bacterium RIFCSPLOWO2_02_FULL_51_21]
MESALHNLEGKKVGTVKLPESIFGLRWNADLVKQVADSILSSRRKNVAHTKTRGEVRGGGRKPWQQKGTGRARHGSTRSPIWVGGGVTHGPRNDKNFERTVSKSMRVKALYTILAQKNRDGEILFVDALSLPEGKTRAAVKALKNFEHVFSKRKNALAIALSANNTDAKKAFGNLGNVEVLEARNLDPITLLQYKYLMIENPERALGALPKMKKTRNQNVKA